LHHANASLCEDYYQHLLVITAKIMSFSRTLKLDSCAWVVYDLPTDVMPDKIQTSPFARRNRGIGPGGLPMAAQRTGAVSVATLAGLLLALVFADLVAPQWCQEFGLDVWNFRAVREDARRVEEQAVSVEAQRVRLVREIELAGQTSGRLIEAKITLAEAIDELEPVLLYRVGFECSWPLDPPPTFRHAVARYIITRVKAELATNPDKLASVSARLNAEYAALK